MQSKGLIKFFAIAFAVVCLYQLSFTYFTNKVEREASEYARSERVEAHAEQLAAGDDVLKSVVFDSLARVEERRYLDSMMNEEVYNLGVRQYTFRECKERELNLGLDLRGGMNVTLEVSVPAILRALSGNSEDPAFLEAIERANQMERERRENYVTLFGEAFEEIDPNASLAAIFSTEQLRDHISYDSSNDEVLDVLSDEVDDAVDRSFEILRTRIDRFGVAQPNIQRLQRSGRILIEMPGIKEPDRVRSLLQGTARLEFWETYEFSEVHNYFVEANERLRGIDVERVAEEVEEAEPDVAPVGAGEPDPEVADEPEEDLDDLLAEVEDEVPDTAEEADLLDLLSGEVTQEDEEQFRDFAEENPLFAYLQPSFVPDESGNMYPGRGPVVGYAAVQDTATVNYLIEQEAVQQVLPRDMELYWDVNPAPHNENLRALIAIRETTRDGSAPLDGNVITTARQDYDQHGNPEISMSMNREGARTWSRLTADNIGSSVAIVLDDYVYSYPTVQAEITGGRSSISGNFTVQEAQDLANILRAGSLPAPARIVEEAVVGPSLGQEAIQSGFTSFVIAFVIVLIYMVFYYNRAGMVADIALLTNMFFILGVLASLGAALTLPGIAGIVLTLGMAVDANVIIYERILEELRAGKGQRLAISDGYKNAYSAIVDGNVTTILTGIVLYMFGTGPVQGFATTLIIGIICSLFTAIFLSRLVFTYWLDKNVKINFDNRITKDILTKVNFDFIGVRKRFYVISAIIIIVGVGSLVSRGLSYGVDFSGGRSYIVRFDNEVSTVDIRNTLMDQFEEAPEVKTFGPPNQVEITTGYLIEETAPETDSIVERTVFEGIKGFFDDPITFDEFTSDDEDKVIGRLSSQLVGPSVARDIREAAVVAVAIALIIIFFYIAVRFKKWQFGAGGMVTLFHDSIIVLSVYSLLYNVVPFSLEIDQAFIAAILTIIGYSINDTVIIFDRIREYTKLYPKRELKNNINVALNSVLSRTLNTSGTTLLVLLIIFLLGGEVIRGFAFALFVGVAVGTYSSLFSATPVAYDLIMMKANNQSKKAKAAQKANPKKKK